MYFLAHEGYTLLAAEIFSIVLYLINKKILNRESAWSPWGWRNFSVIALLIGAIGPDIIDKAISYPVTGHSRYIAHSLLFDVLISIVALILFRKKARISLAFIFGWQMHLILDLRGFLPLFYPFIAYTFPTRTNGFLVSLLDPYNYINEIFGSIIILVIIFLYYKRQMLALKYMK